MNAAFTYLAPVRDRPNLTLIPDALVDRVLIEDGRAIGVRTADGREIRGRQVVLCAGAYGSPAILLRSGIGPAADLRELGIPVVADRPGVGAHLLDHPNVIFANGDDIAPFVIKPAYAPAVQSVAPLDQGAQSAGRRRHRPLSLLRPLRDEECGRWLALFGLNLEVARSEGRVRLTSPDPAATLDIDHAYLADPADLEAFCDGVELIGALDRDQPLAAVLDPLPGQVPTWRDRDELARLGPRPRRDDLPPLGHLPDGAGRRPDGGGRPHGAGPRRRRAARRRRLGLPDDPARQHPLHRRRGGREARRRHPARHRVSGGPRHVPVPFGRHSSPGACSVVVGRLASCRTLSAAVSRKSRTIGNGDGKLAAPHHY